MRGWMGALALAGATMGLGCGGSREAARGTTPNTATAPSLSPERRTTLLEEAQAAWAGRDDEASVRSAIEKYGAVTEAAPSDHEAWVMLSRSYYFLADCHLRFDETKREEFLRSFEHGTQAAERALIAMSDEFAQRMRAGPRIEGALDVLDASAVPGLYWRASNLGKWASADGFATLLSYKDEIRAVMARCLELDREYYYWGPDRYFGVFYGRAPSFAGGDVARSREHFETSVRHAPHYFATRVLMAQDYAVKAQDRATFDEELAYVLEHDPEEGGPDIAPENRCEQRKARELLARADELFEP